MAQTFLLLYAIKNEKTQGVERPNVFQAGPDSYVHGMTFPIHYV